jgi:Catalase
MAITGGSRIGCFLDRNSGGSFRHCCANSYSFVRNISSASDRDHQGKTARQPRRFAGIRSWPHAVRPEIRKRIRFRRARPDQDHSRGNSSAAHVGRVLDRNVDNFFAETEQVAFCVRNVCRQSIFQTIRSSKVAYSPTWTLSSSASAARIFSRFR